VTDEREKDRKPAPGPAPAPRDDLPVSAQRRRGATRCPFCTAALRPGQPVSRCAGCGARLHLGCLGESGQRGCPVCQGTVFAEAVAERHARRLQVDARELRLQAIATPVGAVVGVLALPLSCFTTFLLVEGMGVRSGPLVLLVLLAALLIPLGLSALAVQLLRRVATWQRRRAVRASAPADAPAPGDG
jgi:hypothetical protein